MKPTRQQALPTDITLPISLYCLTLKYEQKAKDPRQERKTSNMKDHKPQLIEEGNSEKKPYQKQN